MLRSLSPKSSSSSYLTRANSGRYFGVPIIIYLLLRLLSGK
jgi:hypothetical protein